MAEQVAVEYRHTSNNGQFDRRLAARMTQYPHRHKQSKAQVAHPHFLLGTGLVAPSLGQDFESVSQLQCSRKPSDLHRMKPRQKLTPTAWIQLKAGRSFRLVHFEAGYVFILFRISMAGSIPSHHFTGAKCKIVAEAGAT